MFENVASFLPIEINGMAREDSLLLMKEMKVFITTKKTCKATTPYDACPWLGKVLTCQELNRVTIMETSTHETLVRSPRKPKLAPRLKDYDRETAILGLKPPPLSALRKIFTAATGRQLLVEYAMADAEVAQRNAVEQVFGVDSDYVYPMCFFHVVVKVHEKLKGMPRNLCEQVVSNIYDLHFASSQEVYDQLLAVVLNKWSHDDRLTGFRSYFD
ncbi:hypothetical protein BBJ29_009944 [Phytophthora kernoviae]|uniref:MULE transposase domain-containing protein n=1 Tax=Phytophthora kernoviae TaxID=325452 RepID=A0A3F2RF17_9STRA|nr:hypothetical protein BBP00_00008562 [Phytophthora kernoviae]RLN65812.1 hypothetical protein BBJ29_009944 [Phytophthora kernoviae]